LSKKPSKDDISAIAEHSAGLTFKPVSQSVDAALAAKGKEIFESTCDKRHSKGGTDAGDDVGIIGGQWKPYLQGPMKLFSEDKRATQAAHPPGETCGGLRASQLANLAKLIADS